jgi:hypothetical protein
MKALHERIEGQGQLENWDQPGNKFSVDYEFDITTEILEKPGLPPVGTRKHSRGNVSSSTREFIEQGYYRLYASDGEILRVQNVGLDLWVILAS